MSDEILYLFSSNIRPLYVQDVLDVLAAPSGSRRHFRYEERYVTNEAKKVSAGTAALIVFSIQQEARYHEPVFIPVRCGKVVSAGVSAGIFVVEFEVARYVALAGDFTADGDPNGDNMSDAVRRFTTTLADRLGYERRPYKRSASLGPSILADDGFIAAGISETDAFRTSARALHRTEWFKSARFIRFLRIREEAGRGADVAISGGEYVLTAGSTYQLDVTHYEPADITTREEFTISADGDLVQVIGRPGFDVASRYDLMGVPIHATLPQRDQARKTVIAIEPTAGVQGPTIRLPIHVIPDKQRTVALTVSSAVVLALIGAPAIFTDWSVGWKALCVFVATLGGAWLNAFGFPVSLNSLSGVGNKASG